MHRKEGHCRRRGWRREGGDAARSVLPGNAQSPGEEGRAGAPLRTGEPMSDAPTTPARNPERNVVIGGDGIVFAPVYGPPFVRSLDEPRRYGTIEDFRNLVKLAYMTPAMHHSGGTVCEPVDLPVNKRHLDMVYSHIRYSDKPFMGSVTHPERAADTVEMAKLLFGADFLDSHTCIISLINANSPMVWAGTMLGALKA